MAEKSIADQQRSAKHRLYTQVLADYLSQDHPLAKNPHVADRAKRHCYALAAGAMRGFPEYDKTQAVDAALDLRARRGAILTGFDQLAAQRDRCTRDISAWAWRHADMREDEVRDTAEEWIDRLWGIRTRPGDGADLLLKAAEGAILDNIGADATPAKGITQKWLRRRIRAAVRQAQEAGHLLFHDIGKDRQEYASDWTTKNRTEQLKTQDLWMRCTAIVDQETGESVTLADVARNAKMKLAEALTIIDGMEKIGSDYGYSMLFITLTLPPEYHPHPQNGSDSWDGSSPRDGHIWIRKRWARVRASLAKRRIGAMFVRTAEPHKDSSPHWHIMLWTDDPDESEKLVLKHFKHSDSSTEIRRLSYKDDDSEKASATSYLLKYIVKTLPSETDDAALLEKFSVAGTKRVDAWRATYGIRALQYGGLPRGAVTAWRESRRAAVGEGLVIPMQAIPLLAAARDSDFQTFVEEMQAAGVSLLKKRDLWTPEERDQAAPGDGQRVMGIKTDDWAINTHSKRWTAQLDSRAFFEKLNQIKAGTVMHKFPRGPGYPESNPRHGRKSQQTAAPPPKTAPPSVPVASSS